MSIQELSMKGLDVIQLKDIIKDEEYVENLYKKIKQGLIPEVRKEWLENGYELRSLLKNIFQLIVKDNLEVSKMKRCIELIAEIEYRMAVGSDNDITLYWGIMKLREVLK